MSELTDAAAVACSLGESDRSDRGERWERIGARAGHCVLGTTDGLWLVFRNLPAIRNELAELSALERECCAFADWQIRDDEDYVVLAVSARSVEAVRAVHEMRNGFAAALQHHDAGQAAAGPAA